MPDEIPTPQLPGEWLRQLPGNLWKKFLDHLTGIIFGAIVTIATALTLYVNDLIFDPATSRTIAQQDKFGMYCLNTIFASARSDGAKLQFDPARLENTGICGQPPSSGALKDRDILGTVFSQQLQGCMVAELTNSSSHEWTIEIDASGSSKIANLTMDHKKPFFACKCTPAQVALLALEKKGRPWCGNDVLPPGDVRSELRDFPISW